MTRKLLVGVAASALAIGGLTTLGAPAASANEARPVASTVHPNTFCDGARTTDGHRAWGRCSNWPRYYLTATACGPSYCRDLTSSTVSWPAYATIDAGSAFIDQRTIFVNKA